MKSAALLGGSFNPPHTGHFEMGKYIHQTLGVDEVWYLFSVNIQKDAAKYASTAHRMEMGRIMARHYPDCPFVMSDIEDDIGTHITHDVLGALTARFPDYNFTWVIGADNLLTFHTWEHYDQIIENFPVAVVDRPPYTDQAKKSPTAMAYPHLQRSGPQDLISEKSGWCFLDTPNKIEMSSTHLLDQLRSGVTTFNGPFQDVADYIVRHGLYGINQSPVPNMNLAPAP